MWMFRTTTGNCDSWGMRLTWNVNTATGHESLQNLPSKTESKHFTSMLQFLMAHPIPSQSWWASYSCTGGRSKHLSKQQASEQHTCINIFHKDMWRKCMIYSWSCFFKYVDTPTQELVVMIYSYTRVWCEALDGFLCWLPHRSWIKSFAWIPILSPT